MSLRNTHWVTPRMPPAVGGSRKVAIKLVSRRLLCDDVVERGGLKSTGSTHLGDHDAVVCVQPRRAAYRHFCSMPHVLGVHHSLTADFQSQNTVIGRHE